MAALIGQINKSTISIYGSGIYYLTPNGYLLNHSLWLLVARFRGGVKIVAKLNIKLK